MKNKIYYYIFYLKPHKDNFYLKEESVYAFTTEKEEAIEFMKFRRKDIFLKEKVFLTIDERKEFLDIHANCRMKRYLFQLKNIKLSIILTYEEYLNIESRNIKESIIIKSYATINPNIFKKKYFKTLYDIGYTESWMAWKYGTMDDCSDDRLFDIFIEDYGNTISLDKLRKEMTKCIYI